MYLLENHLHRVTVLIIPIPVLVTVRRTILDMEKTAQKNESPPMDLLTTLVRIVI